MKRLLMIFIFLPFGFGYTLFASAPQYEFKSTSSYLLTEYNHLYTMPVSEIQLPFYSPLPRLIVEYGENPGYDPADPAWEYDTPVGDGIIPLLIISLSYCLYIKLFKKSPI